MFKLFFKRKENGKKLIELIERINQLKTEIDKFRPISPEQEQKMMQKFRLDWNFHSTSIEGNTLIFGETNTFILYWILSKVK